MNKKWPLILLVLLGITAVCMVKPLRPRMVQFKNRKKVPEEAYDELKSYKAILLGEIHGTNEAPEMLEGIVTLFLSHNESILIGLEMNSNTQDSVNQFLKSGNIEILNHLSFFTSSIKDGRSSAAMANLLKHVAKNDKVKVVCFAKAVNAPSFGADSVMAVNLNNAMKSNPNFKLIALCGDMHNKRHVFKAVNGSFLKTMGFMLDKIPGSLLKKEEFVSLDMIYEKGTAWYCTPGCGVYEAGNAAGGWAKQTAAANFIIINDPGGVQDYNGLFFSRKISASKPYLN